MNFVGKILDKTMVFIHTPPKASALVINNKNNLGSFITHIPVLDR